MHSFLRSVSFSLPGLVLFAAISAAGQVPIATPPAQQRIVQPVDDSRLTRLAGSVHPAVAKSTDLGPVSASLAMDRMQLVLQRGPERQAAFDAFTESQYNPASPNYHHWLSPDQVGTLFGISDADLATVTSWLQASGFTVNSISKGRLTIEFSGTAAQVQNAFHTEIHNLTYKGEQHIANVSSPQIPSALTPVVTGLLSLNNFLKKSQMIKGPDLERSASGKITRVPSAAAGLKPLYNFPVNGGTDYFVAPYDFATIYNSLPLWNAGINGTGVKIAIVGRSDITLSDVATFQSTLGLPNNPPTIIHNGRAPGVPSSDDVFENTLDVEWSGATAPGAKINFVTSASTSTSDGVDLSALYIIDNQVAPIMSESYGYCELGVGTAGNAFYNSLWQQASAEGISAFISVGDQLSAGCDDNSQQTPFAAQFGLAVSGLASSPYVTSVGGTDFNDLGNTAAYWNTSNAANGSSVKSYIPEIPWNDSCGNPAIDKYIGLGTDTLSAACNILVNTADDFLLDTIGGSGGVSNCTTPTGTTVASCAGGWPKPSWQAGVGVPADGKRDMPDLSLLAADGLLGHAYVVEVNGKLTGVGGTSASSPSMAGIMALVVQKQGAAQGLANPVLYSLAATENLSSCNATTVGAGNACIFYDTTYGTIIPPCYAGTPNCISNTSDPSYAGAGVLSGYTTTTGYDLATGLGSVNVTNLVNNWHNAAPVSTATSITLTPTTLPALSVGTPYYQQLTAGGGTAPYTYFVSSGSLPSWLTLTPDGVLSGVPPAISSFSFTITARDSSLNGPFAGSQAYSQTVVGASAPSAISWIPARLTTYSGFTVGADVLDATTLTPGAVITYTATLANDGSPFAITSNYYLQPGTYTLTATSGAATASIPFTVIAEHVWIVNSTGSLVVLDAAGNTTTVPFAGGMGIGIDNGGTVWSATTTGTSLSAFANTGVVTSNGPAVGGISSPAAIAIDGNGYIWTANSNSSVSAISPLGVALSPSTGFVGGNLSTPSGIAIDISGNVWISNKGSNSVTEILGGAAPVEVLSTAQTQRNLGAKP